MQLGDFGDCWEFEVTHSQVNFFDEKSIPTINEHLKNIFEEAECAQDRTIRKFLIVRQEGARSVTRNIEDYYFKCLLAKARPAPDFKYLSKSKALSLQLNAK